MSLSITLFYGLLSGVFLLEGLGLPQGREVSFAIILLTPYFLLSLDLLKKREIKIPHVPIFLYAIFLVFTLVSTFLSVNWISSFNYFLFYTSLFLSFIFCYNHAEEIKKILTKWIIFFSVFYCIYSLFFAIFPGMDTVLPQDGYQYVFARFGLHNHRGDFLILGIVTLANLFFEKRYKMLSLLGIVVFLPFLLFSYSRSSLIALAVTLFFMTVYLLRNHKYGKQIILPTCVIVISILFFFLTIKELGMSNFISSFRQPLLVITGVHEKTLTHDRIMFWSQALTSIQQRPLFGVGPNQFSMVSNKHYSEVGLATDSSHNIVIDIFVENGILAGVCFTIFMGYIFAKAKKTFFYFLVLAMIINFQFDYTFKIYSFIFLFFCIAGIVFNRDNKSRT